MRIIANLAVAGLASAAIISHQPRDFGGSSEIVERSPVVDFKKIGADFTKELEKVVSPEDAKKVKNAIGVGVNAVDDKPRKALETEVAKVVGEKDAEKVDAAVGVPIKIAHDIVPRDAAVDFKQIGKNFEAELAKVVSPADAKTVKSALKVGVDAVDDKPRKALETEVAKVVGEKDAKKVDAAVGVGAKIADEIVSRDVFRRGVHPDVLLRHCHTFSDPTSYLRLLEKDGEDDTLATVGRFERCVRYGEIEPTANDSWAKQRLWKAVYHKRKQQSAGVEELEMYEHLFADVDKHWSIWSKYQQPQELPHSRPDGCDCKAAWKHSDNPTSTPCLEYCEKEFMINPPPCDCQAMYGIIRKHMDGGHRWFWAIIRFLTWDKRHQSCFDQCAATADSPFPTLDTPKPSPTGPRFWPVPKPGFEPTDDLPPKNTNFPMPRMGPIPHAIKPDAKPDGGLPPMPHVGHVDSKPARPSIVKADAPAPSPPGNNDLPPSSTHTDPGFRQVSNPNIGGHAKREEATAEISKAQAKHGEPAGPEIVHDPRKPIANVARGGTTPYHQWESKSATIPGFNCICQKIAEALARDSFSRTSAIQELIKSDLRCTAFCVDTLRNISSQYDFPLEKLKDVKRLEMVVQGERAASAGIGRDELRDPRELLREESKGAAPPHL